MKTCRHVVIRDLGNLSSHRSAEHMLLRRSIAPAGSAAAPAKLPDVSPDSYQVVVEDEGSGRRIAL